MKKKTGRKKKGVSPLIATVLLTGFTVSIIALVIVWGKAFTTETAEKEEALSHARLACENMDYTVTSASYSTAGQKILLGIKNKGTQTLDSFVFRVIYGIEGSYSDVQTVETTFSLKGAEEMSIPVENPDIKSTAPFKVEIIPKIKVATNVYLPCSNQARSVLGNKMIAA